MSAILFLDHLDTHNAQVNVIADEEPLTISYHVDVRATAGTSYYVCLLGVETMSRLRIFATDLTRRDQHSTYFCWLMLGRPSRT